MEFFQGSYRVGAPEVERFDTMAKDEMRSEDGETILGRFDDLARLARFGNFEKRLCNDDGQLVAPQDGQMVDGGPDAWYAGGKDGETRGGRC